MTQAMPWDKSGHVLLVSGQGSSREWRYFLKSATRRVAGAGRPSLRLLSEQNLSALRCAQKGMNAALGIPSRSADHCRWSAILLAIFLAASALTPDSRRSMFTITSPLRIMRAEFPAAR